MLPDVLDAWTGQLELDGLIPQRAAADAVQALLHATPGKE